MSFSKKQRDFFKQGNVRIIVPEVSIDQDGSAIGSNESVLDVQQRTRLFFDENLKIYVVLRLPECDEDVLKSYLSRLDITVDVWASSDGDNISRQTANPAANRDLIFSQHLKHDDDPIVLVTQGNDEKVYMSMVWETNVVINRPHVRLMEPCIAIYPSVSLSPTPVLGSSDVLLEPFVGQEANVLSSLNGAKGFENSTPYLPLSRLKTVLPSASKEDPLFHFATAPPTMIRVFPITMTRLKYTKAWGQPSGTALTASLDVELVPFVDIQGTIDVVNLTLASGKVLSLTGDMLPLHCQSKDCVTFLYQLQSRNDLKQKVGNISDPNIDVMTISVKLTLHLTSGCRPEILTEWNTNVDFSQPLERLSTPVGQSLQRMNRPPSLSLHKSDIVLRPGLEPSHGDGLVTISFSAPIKPVKVGKPFAWKVLVVNRTQDTARLAIIPLPRIQRTISQAQQYARRHASRNSNTSFKHAENVQGLESDDVAQAAVDENILYAMQHSGGIPAQADIVSLTSELKIGPLLAGQCYEDEVKMVAFSKGPQIVDAIRVVDLVREAEEGPASPGVIIDIRDLPDVVVED